jgi:hypothetical protein
MVRMEIKCQCPEWASGLMAGWRTEQSGRVKGHHRELLLVHQSAARGKAMLCHLEGTRGTLKQVTDELSET